MDNQSDILRKTGLVINPVHGVDQPVTTSSTSSETVVVSGIVSSGGSVTAGSGFTATRNSAGDYTVTFNTAFSSTPVVVMTGTAGFLMGNIAAASASSFEVIFKNTSGTATDSGFHFMARDIS